MMWIKTYVIPSRRPTDEIFPMRFAYGGRHKVLHDQVIAKMLDFALNMRQFVFNKKGEQVLKKARVPFQVTFRVILNFNL